MIIIHPGYPKTGSTWLQKVLFVKNNGFMQLAGNNVQRIGGYYLTPVAAYDAEEIRAFTEKKIENAVKENLVPVISSEGFVGAFRSFTNGLTAEVVAGRLKNFKDVKILIGLREQVDMIMSLYNQFLRHFGTKHILRYILEFEGRSAEFQSPGDFCYDRIIRLYHDLFGKEYVMVYMLEQFAEKPAEFLAQFKSFSGGRFFCENVNTQVFHNSKAGEYLAYNLTRWMGLPGRFMTEAQIKKHGEFVKRLRGGLAGKYSEGQERRFVARQKKIVQRCTKGIFAESNRKTVQLTGLNLQKYGYEM